MTYQIGDSGLSGLDGYTWAAPPPYTTTQIGLSTNTCGSSSTLNVPSACEITGTCTLSEDLLEYLDGKVIGQCLDCFRRIEVPRIPGAFVVQRLKELLTNACSDSYSESLGQLAEILDLFRSEKESLNEAEGLLRLTIDVLEKKSGEKLDVAL